MIKLACADAQAALFGLCLSKPLPHKFNRFPSDLPSMSSGRVSTIRLKQDLKLSPRDIVIVPKSNIAKVDQWIDQYIRRVLPFGTSVSYTYTEQRN